MCVHLCSSLSWTDIVWGGVCCPTNLSRTVFAFFFFFDQFVRPFYWTISHHFFSYNIDFVGLFFRSGGWGARVLLLRCFLHKMSLPVDTNVCLDCITHSANFLESRFVAQLWWQWLTSDLLLAAAFCLKTCLRLVAVGELWILGIMFRRELRCKAIVILCRAGALMILSTIVRCGMAFVTTWAKLANS